MMKKKKQSGTQGHKPKAGRKLTVSLRPKANAPPQDMDVNVGNSATGYHDYKIVWHNQGKVDELVDFYTAKGCPFEDPYCPCFIVRAGKTLKTPIRDDARGTYTYRTCPLPLVGQHGGDPTVIIQ
jgi:hypothetical protein